MSMTVEEARRNMIEATLNAGYKVCVDVDAVAEMLRAEEEPQQYRAIGTVERFKYLSKSEHNYENCHNLTCRTQCEKDGYVKAIEEFANILRAELIYTPVSCEYDYTYEIAMVDVRKKVNRIEQELKGECRK